MMHIHTSNDEQPSPSQTQIKGDKIENTLYHLRLHCIHISPLKFAATSPIFDVVSNLTSDVGDKGMRVCALSAHPPMPWAALVSPLKPMPLLLLLVVLCFFLEIFPLE
jgi:hypothetical protein